VTQSIDQILPKDLAKINSYLEEVEISLSHFHNKKETKEIILILREQLFQQIELQATLNRPFDIDAIIAKNRRDNQALITGNDRNEVVFSIKNPFKLSSKEKGIRSSDREPTPSMVSPQPEVNNEAFTDQSTSSHTKHNQKSKPPNDVKDSSISSEHLNRLKRDARYLLYPIAVFIILACIFGFHVNGGIFHGQNSGILSIISFALIANLYIEKPTSTWIKANILYYFGLIFYFGFMDYYEVLNDFYVFVVLLPLILSLTNYSLLSTNLLKPDYSNLSRLKKFGFLILMTAPLYLIEYLLILFVSGMYFDTFLVTSGFLSIIGGILYYTVVMKKLHHWDRRLQGELQSDTGRYSGNHSETQFKSSAKNESTEPDSNHPVSSNTDQKRLSQIQPSRNNSLPLKSQQSTNKVAELEELLGIGSPDDWIDLQLNIDKAKNLTGFKFISFARTLLFILVAVTTYLIFYISSLSYSGLEYLLDQLNLLSIFPTSTAYDRLNLQPLVMDLLKVALVIIIGIIILFYLVELFKYFRRSDLRKIIPHLVLRQGKINIRSLSVCPPGVDPIVYYNQLGNLVMKGTVKLKHVGVKS